MSNTDVTNHIKDDVDDDTDIVLFGDDGGFVNVLHLKRKFFENMTDNSVLEQLTPAILTKKKVDPKSAFSNITFFRVSISVSPLISFRGKYIQTG